MTMKLNETFNYKWVKSGCFVSTVMISFWARYPPGPDLKSLNWLSDCAMQIKQNCTGFLNDNLKTDVQCHYRNTVE